MTTKSATTTDEEKPKIKRKSPIKKDSKVIDESSIKTIVNVIDSGSRRMNILIPRDSTNDNIIVQEAFQPHKDIQRWIIFSDLHVKASSIDICEQVLYQVHETAKAKQAGDFWHNRGSLSVELLNRVLKCLRKWKQPVIMIPGNHDQVTLGGGVHALEPLRYAFDESQIMMISEPTITLGALWIPYRRSATVMRKVLSEATKRDDISMIFCHADVRGAFMNDNIRSQEGLEASDFPANMPVYTGHFHKPHTIVKKGSKVCYVGSPYQTSLSEAFQDKFLYCMTCLPFPSSPLLPPSTPSTVSVLTSSAIPSLLQVSALASSSSSSSSLYQWKEESRTIIDVGRKYYKATLANTELIQRVRSGDKLVLQVKVGEEYQADQLMLQLRQEDIDVELRIESYKRVTATASVDKHKADTLLLAQTEEGEVDVMQSLDEHSDPITVFRQFMSSGKYNDLVMESLNKDKTHTTEGAVLDSTVTNRTLLHNQVLEEGTKALQKFSSSSSVSPEGRSVDKSDLQRVHNLQLLNVTLSNFGPYGGEPVSYPLAKRGLVLITAESSDNTGADSNGAGKTSLAMSVMWSLTGSLDARLAGDSKATDVAYDPGLGKPKRTAEVTVEGIINSLPFKVTRRRSPRQAELLFSLDWKDLTTQAVKDTQALIDHHLGIGDNLLRRCCFFGQHSHMIQSLLGLSDVKLKDELSVLVDTQIWSDVLQDTKQRQKLAKARTAEITTELKIRQEDHVRTQKELIHLQDSVILLQTAAQEAQRKVDEVMGSSKDSLSQLLGGNQTHAELTVKWNDAKLLLSELTQQIEPLRSNILSTAKDSMAKIKIYDNEIMKIKSKLDQIELMNNQYSKNIAGSQLKLKGFQGQLRTNKTVQDTLKAQLASNASATTTATAHPTLVVDDRTTLATILVHLKAGLDSARSELSLLDTKMTASRVVAGRLKEVLKLASTKAQASPAGATSCTEHQADNCPTCGQSLPKEQTLTRLQDVTTELEAMVADRVVHTKAFESLKTQLDICGKLKEALDQSKVLEGRVQELEDEIAQYDTALSQGQRDAAPLKSQLITKVEEKRRYESEAAESDKDNTERLKQLEARLKQVQGEEVQLKSKLEQMQKVEQLSHQRQTSANATLAMAQDKLLRANNDVSAKEDVISSITHKLGALQRENELQYNNMIVFTRLVDVFGPRGVQQFLFVSVIRQLEEIVNGFLTLLADGGIQLSLQGEWDSEKIVKKVLIRSMEGELRERSLDQLSGGQLGRVRLALDFAFGEVVRRKGSLRCNLMVLDEILTHLDATGREAVGTLLRAFINRHTAASDDAIAEDDLTVIEDSDSSLPEVIKPSKTLVTTEVTRHLLSGGSYDTVLMILQDLSALEMEEAFDHVDIVQKISDTATVRIDGVNA